MSGAWCENDKRTFIQCANGQINPQSAVGSYLMKLVEVNHLRTVVDIGTWNGMGAPDVFCCHCKEKTRRTRNSLVWR